MSVPAPGKTLGNPLQDKDCKSWVKDVIIFVETNSDGSGELYHVVGSMKDGFDYEKKKQGRLETSRTFSHKVLQGKLESNNIPCCRFGLYLKAKISSHFTVAIACFRVIVVVGVRELWCSDCSSAYRQRYGGNVNDEQGKQDAAKYLPGAS
jgi:hypothetical protein